MAIEVLQRVNVFANCFSNFSTLQLLLPDDISESLFTTLAGMVPSVFHVANPKILVDTSK